MIIVLTGCTHGLGKAMIKEFTKREHTVFGCGRSKSSLNMLSKLYPSPNRFDQVDVADWPAVQRWAKKLSSKQAPDIIINNAGVMNSINPLWKISDSDFSKVLDVNVKGSANVIRAFVPRMVRRKSGAIINFSSGWGRSTSEHVAPYCASKWAIEGLTKAFSQELPRGMAAVALNPGIINTRMLKKCFGANAEDYPSAEEWAEKAVRLILKINKNHNGKSLTVSL